MGLDWYDYGFRWYDASIARFVSVDPLAEDFVHLTTYQYASNDPIVNIDLDGLEGININTGQTQVNPAVPHRRQNVTVDPGHGDNHAQNRQIDPGAVSPTGDLNENDLALGVSTGVSNRLAEVGIDANMTRTDDINVDPQNRLQWRIDAAENSTMFVSVHINSATNENASGFVVLYNGEESQELANSIAGTQEIMNVRGDGTNQRTDLYVLNNFENGPAVLVEVGFITNEQDRNTIQNNAPAIGREIGNGIIDYLIDQGIVTRNE